MIRSTTERDGEFILYCNMLALPFFIQGSTWNISFAFVKGLKYHFYILMALLHVFSWNLRTKALQKGFRTDKLLHHVTWSIEQKTKLTVSPHVRQSKTVLATDLNSTPWIPDSRYWIPDSGFRIPLLSGFPPGSLIWTWFRISKLRILDSNNL